MVDLSEPTKETNETVESKKDEEISDTPETKANEQVDVEKMIEVKVAVEPEPEAMAVVKVEPEPEATPAEENVVSETETSPELLEELKAVVDQTSEDKSDAPLVTM